MVIAAAIVTIGEEDNPPRAVFGLHEVAMTCTLNRQILAGQRTVGKQWVVGVSLIRAVDILAAGNGEAVSHLRATLRNQQIVVAILLVDMRPLRIAASRTLPERLALSELLARLGVNLTEHNSIIWI